MPDIVFESEEKIPEGLKGHEKKLEDGTYVVKVAPAAKIDEFRTKNIELSKERDTLADFASKAKNYVGEDLEAFEAELVNLRKTSQEVKDGKLKASGDVEAEVVRRVESMKKGFEDQLSSKAKENGELTKKVSLIESKWKQSKIDRYVTDAVLDEKNGADPRALNDILSHAYSVFKVRQDEAIVPMDGEAVIYGADGATPMTPSEWLAKLRENAPYFFKNSNGGGAAGGQGNKKFGGMSEADFSKLTPIQKLQIANGQKV